MDWSGGPPLKQNHVFGVQNPWSPVTPVKNIPRGSQLISSPCCSQRNQASEPNWLDPLSGLQTATPPWGLSFQNGVCSTPCLPNHLHDLNGCQAAAEASANQETIGSIRRHTANTSGNAGTMNCWSPKLGGNVLAASNALGENKMPPLRPFFGQNGNCSVIPASSNQLLINGNVLQKPGFCNSNSNLACQKTQYGPPVTCLPNQNSFSESTMCFAGSVAMPSLLNHMPTEKYNQRMQDKRKFLELIDLVNENAREENLLMKAVSAEASFSNLIASSEYTCFQNPDCVKDLAVLSDEISSELTGIEKSLAEGENESINLNDASKQKPKRKKHRPKVIIEGKPARTPKPNTPKPKTPKPARDKEKPLGKRKYTRRKKDTTPLEENSLGEIADAESRSGAKSVRRSLNFDLEESQTVDKFSVLMSMFMQNLENHEHGAYENGNLACSRFKETVDSTVVQGPIVENSLAGIVFDLKNSMSTHNEYFKILRTPVLSTTVNQTVGASKNIVNSNSVSVAPPKGIKRDLCLTDDVCGLAKKNLIHSYNTGECVSKSYDAERIASCLTDINKRMRMEKGCNVSTVNPSTKLTYTPSTGWKKIEESNNFQEFTFTDTMNFMAQEKLRTLDCVLLGEEADLNTNNHHALSSNLSSLSELIYYNRNSTPVKPSWQKNNGISQPPTPDKPSGYSYSQESKSCGAPVQFEISEDVNKPVKAKGRRGRKKREENTPSNLFASPTGASHGQINPGVATTTSRHLHGKNLHPEVISFNRQDISNYKAWTNSSFPSLTPYMDFVDYIVQKLSRLSIDRDNVVSSHAQNAIVPYVMNGGAMVPYESTFEIAKRRRPRARVDLDPETNRVWKLLMGIECERDDGLNVDTAKWWEEERRVFRGRADSFIARMHLVQGDRRFSQWKGSVVDSVIGVFLTQNVSDHLSSSAFMALAAKFPLPSRYSSAANVKSPMENQSASITALADTPKLQRDILDHDFYGQVSSEMNDVKNEGKKEISSSNETLGSGTGSCSVVYCAGKVLESPETELSSCHESPNSGSNTVVTVTTSISSVEIEDRKLVEEVVSSQNSGFSLQNSMESQFFSSDHIGSNSTLKIDSDDLLIGSMNNGFGRSSFTELLHIAESNKFKELYNHVSMSCTNNQVIHKIGNNFPVLDQLDNSNDTCQPYQAGFTPHHTLFRLSDMLPESQFFYSLPPSNFTVLEDNTNTLNEEIRSSLPSTTYEIVRGNKLEENLAENYSLSMLLASSGTASAIDSYVPIRIQSEEQSTFSETEVGIDHKTFGHKKLAERTDASSNIANSHRFSIVQDEDMARSQQKDGYPIFKAEISQDTIRVQSQMENYGNPKTSLTSNNDVQNKLDVDQTVGSNLKDESYNFQKVSSETPKQGEKARRRRAESEKKTFDWDSLRKEVNCNKPTKERSTGTMDSLDWEAVRCADVSEISETIRERGMNNMLAERIKDFLNRLVREHGSIDLEWLRDVPPDKSKEYLLSIRGLGLKSTECVRLLTLHHLAFPVDTNVGRICVRLGWVPLQPLPESLQLHLLEMYPVLETIQKYLWPRLCNLDQRTLYELHYQMITFGKVFCTKSKPNCNACPMRGECRHFASAFASARLALPAPEDKSIVSSTYPIASEHGMVLAFTPRSIPQLECGPLLQEPTIQKNYEPIIEEPATPEPECPETLESAIEDAFFEDPDEIPMIKLNFEKFTQNLQNYMQENMELQAGDMSKALVALTPEAACIPMPKLKNISRLRTEHQVYEIPDSHPLLEGLDQREPDDPCPYLIAIWTPGETAQSTEPPKDCCNSQDTGQLCDRSTCFACSSIRESQADKVRGTLLIPCRTAMRGSFPLNGTYFQVNEVFADHHTSRNPIDISREWIWNLPRRNVCFGTSIPTIFRGLTTEGIQQCFWRGFVCVRGFDRVTRAPKPLYARLHFPASKIHRNRREAAVEAEAAQAAAAARAEQINRPTSLQT